MDKIIVNDKEVTKEEFEEIQKDPNKKLQKLSENTYKVLQKLLG